MKNISALKMHQMLKGISQDELAKETQINQLKELNKRLVQDVNLKDHLISEGFTFTELGKETWITECPFCDDPDSGLKVRLHKGYWLWKCIKDRVLGSIIDFVMREHGLTKEEAIEKLARRYFPEYVTSEELEEITDNDLDKIKKYDLRKYLKDHYGIELDSTGRGSCPFHPPDRKSSFNVWDRDGICFWKCFHDGSSGTVIDFIMRKEKISKGDAIKKLKEELNLNSSESEIEREHVYRNSNGNKVLKKVKYKNGKYPWLTFHWMGKDWTLGKGNYELIPYNLDKFEDYRGEEVIVCEGEKDAETVTNLGYLGTSALWGKGNWPEELTKYFDGFNRITFLYDVGNEEKAREHAKKLKTVYPDKSVFIAKVPMEEREADITDYLEKAGREGGDKALRLFEVLSEAEEVKEADKGDKASPDSKPEIKEEEVRIKTVEEILKEPKLTVEMIIDPLVERNGFTLIGGVKGIGKSLFLLIMALHYVSGEDFLENRIIKPGRVLLIQQEISEAGMQDRLIKITTEKQFKGFKNLSVVNRTRNPLKITNQRDFDEIRKEIEELKPDIVALDPLSRFNPLEENYAKSMSMIVDQINRLKTEYSVAIIVVHHISSKQNPDNPNTPTELAGLFRGHSILADSADTLVGLFRLPRQQKRQTLFLPYENYATVEIERRHGKKPKRYAIERGEDSLIFRVSQVWDEIGKKILPRDIADLTEASGGEMLQKDIVSYYSKPERYVSHVTVCKALAEARKEGLLDCRNLPEPGSPKLWFIRKR